MNPELLRNLWLEASPFRLALIAGLLLLVFSATAVAPSGLASTHGVALGLYWFFAVLWGTRSAALAVVGEIRERTWDSQKLSSIGPWTMMWGKLLGATSANWFGALLCLPFILFPAWQDSGLMAAVTYGVILLALGLFAQSVALLSSLMLIRRQTGNWRLDTFLCQVAGLAAAFAYYSLWSSIGAFERSGEQTLTWWSRDFSLGSFHLVSLLLFLGWALIGCWRAMRAELRFANGPFVWLAYLAYLCLYDAGFESEITARAPALLTAGAVVTRLAMAAIVPFLITYGMAFLEPKDPVRLRWLGEQLRAGRIKQAFLALDGWMLSYGLTLILGLALAALLINGDLARLAFPVLAMLGFLTRDVAIFVLMRTFLGGKSDFAALAIIAALYLLVPLIVTGLHLPALGMFFLPASPNPLGPLAAWPQGLVAAWWAARRIGAAFSSR